MAAHMITMATAARNTTGLPAAFAVIRAIWPNHSWWCGLDSESAMLSRWLDFLFIVTSRQLAQRRRRAASSGSARSTAGVPFGKTATGWENRFGSLALPRRGGVPGAPAWQDYRAKDGHARSAVNGRVLLWVGLFLAGAAAHDFLAVRGAAAQEEEPRIDGVPASSIANNFPGRADFGGVRKRL